MNGKKLEGGIYSIDSVELLDIDWVEDCLTTLEVTREVVTRLTDWDTTCELCSASNVDDFSTTFMLPMSFSD